MHYCQPVSTDKQPAPLVGEGCAQSMCCMHHKGRSGRWLGGPPFLSLVRVQPVTVPPCVSCPNKPQRGALLALG